MRGYYRHRPHWRAWTVRPEHFNGGRRMPIEVRTDDDSYIIQALVPGMTVDDVQVEVLEDLVTLRSGGSEDDTLEQLPGEALLSELDRRGGAYRRIRLPEAVAAEQVEAKLEHGVLTVRLPKSEIKRTKRIEVKSS